MNDKQRRNIFETLEWSLEKVTDCKRQICISGHDHKVTIDGLPGSFSVSDYLKGLLAGQAENLAAIRLLCDRGSFVPATVVSRVYVELSIKTAWAIETESWVRYSVNKAREAKKSIEACAGQKIADLAGDHFRIIEQICDRNQAQKRLPNIRLMMIEYVKQQGSWAGTGEDPVALATEKYDHFFGLCLHPAAHGDWTGPAKANPEMSPYVVGAIQLATFFVAISISKYCKINTDVCMHEMRRWQLGEGE